MERTYFHLVMIGSGLMKVSCRRNPTLLLVLFIYTIIPVFAQTSGEPFVEPYINDVLPYVEPELLIPVKGYAYRVHLSYYNQQTEAQRNKVCIFAQDTIRLRFRCIELLNTHLPDTLSNPHHRIKLRLYWVSTEDSVFDEELPFYFNREENSFELPQDIDSVSFQLLPGTYMLEFKGVSSIPSSMTGLHRVNSQNQTSMLDLKTHLTLSIEAPPLIVPEQYVRNSYNIIRTIESVDGTERGIRTRQYYDDFGRLEETLTILPHHMEKALLTYNEYVRLDKPSGKWLPIPVEPSGFVKLSEITDSICTLYNDDMPFSSTQYEETPLGRIYEENAPGVPWHNSGRKLTDYFVNSNNDDMLTCKVFSAIVSPNGTYNITTNGLYSDGTLCVTKSTDEDNRVVLEFKDRQDRTVLIRNKNGNEWLDTYYIYDDMGHLRAVLPPLASSAAVNGTIDQETLSMYAYLYKYDGRERMIAKKIPGADWVYMKYDDGDRLVFTQDGNQRSRNEWCFALNDVFDRPCVNGTCKEPLPDISGQNIFAAYTGDGDLAGYNVDVILNNVKLLTVNYYDCYDFLQNERASVQANLAYIPQQDCDTMRTSPNAVRGLLTGGRIYRLESDSLYNVNATYYGERDRIVQTHATNHLGGYEHDYFKTSFTGKTLLHRHIHVCPGLRIITPNETTTEEVYIYTYDRADRVKTISHAIGGQPQRIIHDYTYDELGRMIKDTRNDSLNVNYQYNLRSWTTNIDTDGYHQRLIYNKTDDLIENTPCYSGNISAFAISSDGQSEHESIYRFQYDNLSRVTSAEYVNLLSAKDQRTGIYEYDAHGNITLLKRYGQYKAMGPRHTIVTAGGLVDKLTLTYNGNQLKKADNNATIVCKNGAYFQDDKQMEVEYLYDANGNMTQDLNKKIVRIEYNLLNLPSRIQYSDSSFIMNTYDALGNKLRTVTGNNKLTVIVPGNITPIAGVINSNGTDYVGNFIYREGILNMVTYEGGYVVYNPQQIYQFGVNGPEYHYYVRDHLGNNVMDVKDDGTVCQQVRYYPFGQPYYIGDDNNNQPFKYNGKEYETMLSWNMTDYGARWQDPAIGRFSTIDPHSEKYYNISPYAYCGNNPVNAYDEMGLDIYPVIFKSGADNDDSEVIGKSYWSFVTFINAMTIFGQTTYGNDFIAGFLEHGQSQYGVKGSGKYSDCRLYLQEYKVNNNYYYMNDNNGRFSIDEIDGKLNIILKLDCYQTTDELVETITHECTLHGYNLEKIIEAYRNEGIESARSVFNKTSEELEHLDKSITSPVFGGALYKKTEKEITDKHPELEAIFKERK